MLLRHFLLVLPLTAVSAIRPKFSWDYVGNMSFVHLCNESGLFNDEALDAIVKFPFVTIEKGQGFNAPCPAGSTAPCAETKIIAQLAAVKARDPTISTVFYMNAVISWYFYHMDTVMRAHRPWQLNQSANGQAVMVSGDKHFNPPKSGMFVYAHNVKEMQDYWIEVCLNATKTPFVDGCFSDSSQPGSHKTGNYLNKKDEAAYEAGKVATMSKVTAAFGGKAGKPYTGSTGVLIGKKSYQDGINAYQIEFFAASEASIIELMAGVKQGYLVQAHTHVVDDTGCASPKMESVVAAFLIGAGDDSYFGSGLWISNSTMDVTQRWCPRFFEQPLGEPLADAVKDASGVYTRSFKSGTKVSFDTHSNAGQILWGGSPQ